MSAWQHIVLIKFPRHLTAEETAWIDGLLTGWPKEIGGIHWHRWGFDTSGRSRGYQWALVMEFASDEALAHYTPHPRHQEFAQWVAQQGAEVLAFDFPVQPGSSSKTS